MLLCPFALIILLTPAILFGQDSNLFETPLDLGINTNDDGLPKQGPRQLHGIKVLFKTFNKKNKDALHQKLGVKLAFR